MRYIWDDGDIQQGAMFQIGDIQRMIAVHKGRWCIVSLGIGSVHDISGDEIVRFLNKSKAKPIPNPYRKESE
jgi:hypothetical protein